MAPSPLPQVKLQRVGCTLANAARRRLGRVIHLSIRQQEGGGDDLYARD
jgi:hypothetical protein